MMMGYDWGFGWGGMWFGWLMMASFSIAVVLLIVWLVKLSSNSSSADTRSTTAGPSRREAALDILQARYARGEVTKEEYLDMRSALGA